MTICTLKEVDLESLTQQDVTAAIEVADTLKLAGIVFGIDLRIYLKRDAKAMLWEMYCDGNLRDSWGHKIAWSGYRSTFTECMLELNGQLIALERIRERDFEAQLKKMSWGVRDHT